MKKILYILIVNCILLIVNCYPQPSITWNRLYDGGFNDKDYGDGLCQTTDGNFVIGGSTRSHGTLALKLNTYGDIIWLKHYYATYGEAITATNDGGCLLASPSFLKVNSSGDSVWYKEYLNSPVTNLYSVTQCSDNGYIACGRAYYDSGYVMRTDIAGNFLWDKVISWNIRTLVLYAISEAYTNGFITIGSTWDINTPVRPTIIRIDSSGNKIWIRINEPNDSVGHAKSVLKLTPYYLIGCGKGFMKIDDQGNVISSKLIPLDFNDEIEDMQIINSNRFVIVTTNDQYPVTSSKLRIIDSSGNTLNSFGLNFSDYIRLNKVHLVGNGDIVFAGDAARYDTSYSDIYAVRTDANLNCPPISVKNISQNYPNEYKVYQNYPNPFNPITNINYELPIANYVKLVIYNILGSEIEVLVNQMQQAGKYKVEWNAANYPSGIYFYVLRAYPDNITKSTLSFVEAKKIILVK